MRGLAVTCFFLSGASGLIFQVIWTRLFSLVFSATTLAISTVLTAFMAGLALGSYLAGKLADRLGDPLRAYGIAEAGVGLLALLLPLVVAHFDSLNAWAYQQFEGNWVVLTLIRFSCSAAVIILPTTLMGATLPLLSRFFVTCEREHSRVGFRVGTLYAINTFGAVLGTLTGGFILLPHLGLSGTNRLAAFANLAVATVVMVMVWRRRGRPMASPEEEELAAILSESSTNVAPQPTVVSASTRRLVIAAFFFSGLAAMIYQVIWSRALAMNIGSSVYSFTLVLTTFLLGLAGGAAAIARLSQRARDPVAWLAVVHVLIATSVGLSYLLIEKLPHLFLFLIDGSRMDAGAIMWRQFLMAALVMFPATFAMGGVFPLTIRIVSERVERVGRDVGFTYSINTLGAIFGSFLAGFVVIPLLQLQVGTYASVVINVLLAGLLVSRSNWRRHSKLVVLTACVSILVAGPLLPRWDLYQVSVGLFRPTVAREALAQGGKWSKPKLVFYRDGVSTTVSVEQWSEKHYSMKNNGKVDASTGEDMPTQITVGLLPILLHPNVPTIRPDVALIGLASGVTAGAILQYPVKQLDVVELEPAIIEASRFFQHVNNRPLEDSRLRLFTDDGRNYLSATQKRYDVIINEPSNPWITGVSNLFTEDYFQIAKRRLKKGGLFCSWAQMYELGPRRVKAIYRAFAQVFPFVYAFAATTLSSDTFIVGSDRPLTVDIRRLRRAFSNPSVSKEFQRARIGSPDDLLALTLMGPKGIRAFITGAQVNTDDNALVEFAAPRDLFNHRKYDYYISRIYGDSWSYGRLDDFIAGYSTSEDWAGLVRSLLRQGRLREAERIAKRVDGKAGERSRRVLLLFDLISPPDEHNGEFSLEDGGPPLRRPTSPKVPATVLVSMRKDYHKLMKLRANGDCQGALAIIEGWSEKAREALNNDVHLVWGQLALRCSQARAAVNILEPLAQDGAYKKRRPVLRYVLASAYFHNADFSKAVKAFEAWITVREQAKKSPLPPRR